jgi:acetyl esterase/lipase
MTSVTVETDHVFATVGGIKLGLDLYRAPQADAPLVVYVHGGGWRSGDKADGRADRITPMAALGVTVASVNYRLVPDATFPDQLHDLKGPCGGCVRTGRAWACAPTGSASGVPRPGRISARCLP